MANVKVAVRVRPICKREEDAKATIVVNEYQENVLGVANPKIEGIEGCSDHRDRIKHFSFDYCYFSLDKSAPNYASQQTVSRLVSIALSEFKSILNLSNLVFEMHPVHKREFIYAVYFVTLPFC
nr:stAR-related lipid transfer protein 9-like isoform X1 [Lytechinus pictus]